MNIYVVCGVGPPQALVRLKEQLAAYAEVLDAAFEKKRVDERAQVWVQAGLLRLYELLAVCFCSRPG